NARTRRRERQCHLRRRRRRRDGRVHRRRRREPLRLLPPLGVRRPSAPRHRRRGHRQGGLDRRRERAPPALRDPSLRRTRRRPVPHAATHLRVTRTGGASPSVLPRTYIHGVASRRLWACTEHGVIYSAPDDATVYGDVACPECGVLLLRYPPPVRA